MAVGVEVGVPSFNTAVEVVVVVAEVVVVVEVVVIVEVVVVIVVLVEAGLILSNSLNFFLRVLDKW